MERNHVDAVARLQEARAFAQWRQQDLRERLPELTREQEEQLQHYLRIAHQHGERNLTLANDQVYKDACKTGTCPFYGSPAKKEIEAKIEKTKRERGSKE
jgi:hypothetical protein